MTLLAAGQAARCRRESHTVLGPAAHMGWEVREVSLDKGANSSLPPPLPPSLLPLLLPLLLPSALGLVSAGRQTQSVYWWVY